MGAFYFMSYQRNALSRLGYRYDTPSFREVVETGKGTDLVYAYCHWHTCAKSRASVYKPHAVVGMRRCPDCGHALNWRADRHAADKKEQANS